MAYLTMLTFWFSNDSSSDDSAQSSEDEDSEADISDTDSSADTEQRNSSTSPMLDDDSEDSEDVSAEAEDPEVAESDNGLQTHQPTTISNASTLTLNGDIAEAVTNDERIVPASSEGSANTNVAMEAPSSSQSLPSNSTENGADATPSPAKKRKRSDGEVLQSTKTNKDESGDLDDGFTCPVCFDSWEMSGKHRLISLRCGHLFGESCIRRWLTECGRQANAKVCPQCKAKASLRDIRYLYAKRVRAIDRTEEHELRNSLEQDRKKLKTVEIELDTLKITYSVTLKKLQDKDAEIERLKNTLRGRQNGNFLEEGERLPNSKIYKLFMENNISLSPDSGSRVMAFTKMHSSLLVSQKSAYSLFTGYGVRKIDMPSFRVCGFAHLTSKIMRDISISYDESYMVCTSLEPCAKIHDLRTKDTSVVVINANKNLWSCAMGSIGRETYLYCGGQQGGTLVFDTRFPNTVVAEYDTIGDLSPAISVVIIQKSDGFPGGGFCVCKLQSIWFYEYQGEDAVQTRLNIEGPFMSMTYDDAQSLLIVTTRITSPEPESRYLIGKLIKVDSRPHFELKMSFFGSKHTPVMTRSSHIKANYASLFTSYIQDTKQLALFDLHRNKRMQSLPVSDVVYDICAIYSRDTYVAALTENKCRIYKLNECYSGS